MVVFRAGIPESRLSGSWRRRKVDLKSIIKISTGKKSRCLLWLHFWVVLLLCCCCGWGRTYNLLRGGGASFRYSALIIIRRNELRRDGANNRQNEEPLHAHKTNDLHHCHRRWLPFFGCRFSVCCPDERGDKVLLPRNLRFIGLFGANLRDHMCAEIILAPDDTISDGMVRWRRRRALHSRVHADNYAAAPTSGLVSYLGLGVPTALGWGLDWRNIGRIIWCNEKEVGNGSFTMRVNCALFNMIDGHGSKEKKVFATIQPLIGNQRYWVYVPLNWKWWLIIMRAIWSTARNAFPRNGGGRSWSCWIKIPSDVFWFSGTPTTNRQFSCTN